MCVFCTSLYIRTYIGIEFLRYQKMCVCVCAGGGGWNIDSPIAIKSILPGDILTFKLNENIINTFIFTFKEERKKTICLSGFICFKSAPFLDLCFVHHLVCIKIKKNTFIRYNICKKLVRH